MPESSFRDQANVAVDAANRATLAETELRRPFELTIGSVKVSMRVCIGRPYFVSPKGLETRADGDRIVFVLAMANSDDGKPMRYFSWGGHGVEPNAGQLATLVDDKGSVCAAAQLENGLDRWVGQLHGSREVLPGRTTSDVLIFAAPNPAASKLTLELPRVNWGAPGVLRVDIPRGRIAVAPAATL